MSYILDALRRLEQDKEKARVTANPVQAVLKGGDPSERPPASGWKGRGFWPWLPAGLLLLFLAVGVTFWVARSTAPVRQEAGPALPSVPSAVAVRGPFPEPGVASLKGPEPNGRRTGSGEAPASTVPLVSPRQASQPTDRTRTASLPVAPPAAPTPVPAVQGPAGPAPEDAWISQPDPVQEAGSAPTAPRGAPQLSPEDRLAGPTPTRVSPGEAGLRISAIVWSPNREKRFAVVNMKTVHEGDFVDDDKVLEIGEDEVVFEKAGRRFSVGMGKR